MNKLMTGTFAIGLLFAAASCGSDSKSDDTTSPDVSTAVSTDASTAASTGAEVSTDDLTPLQAQVVSMTITSAEAAGVTIDPECFTAVVAKMSDADAQLIIDAGVEGTPELSPEGEALGEEASQCVLDATVETASAATVTATS